MTPSLEALECGLLTSSNSVDVVNGRVGSGHPSKVVADQQHVKMSTFTSESPPSHLTQSGTSEQCITHGAHYP